MRSFNVTADSSFIEMTQAISQQVCPPPGYVPPLPHLIRGKLLTTAYEKSKEAAKAVFKARGSKTTSTTARSQS
jgi:hypothetical protein